MSGKRKKFGSDQQSAPRCSLNDYAGSFIEANDMISCSNPSALHERKVEYRSGNQMRYSQVKMRLSIFATSNLGSTIAFAIFPKLLSSIHCVWTQCGDHILSPPNPNFENRKKTLERKVGSVWFTISSLLPAIYAGNKHSKPFPIEV